MGSDKGFKQRSWSYTGERKEKIFEKVERWRKIVVKIQTFAHTWDNRGVKDLAGSKAGNRRQNILTTLSPQFVCHSSFHVTTLSKYHLADTQIYKYGITGKFLFINNNLLGLYFKPWTCWSYWRMIVSKWEKVWSINHYNYLTKYFAFEKAPNGIFCTLLCSMVKVWQ